MVMVDDPKNRAWRPSELSSLSASIYRESPPVPRLLMTLRPFICPFERLIECVPEEATVLDVGCGAGLFLGLLAAAGRQFRGVGFDASSGAIRAACAMADRLRVLGYKADLRFEQIDVRSPWPEGRFDVVSMIDVMHHVALASRHSVLQLARAALRPGGLLIYKDIAENPRWRATANRLHDLLTTREWVRYTPLGDVKDWAQHLDMELRVSESIDRWWYRHDLCVFRRL